MVGKVGKVSCPRTCSRQKQDLNTQFTGHRVDNFATEIQTTSLLIENPMDSNSEHFFFYSANCNFLFLSIHYLCHLCLQVVSPMPNSSDHQAGYTLPIHCSYCVTFWSQASAKSFRQVRMIYNKSLKILDNRSINIVKYYRGLFWL